MNYKPALVAISLACVQLAATCSRVSATGPANAKLPKFSAVEQWVSGHFAAQPDRRPDDILSQSDIAPLFPALEKELHWKVADRQAILDQVPRDDELIVKKLRTKSGRTFMRSMSGVPHGYDRLDRLSRLSDGGKLLDALVRGPDGYKLIEYLADTTGGAAMGKMLSEAPHGENFNQPTGRLYTVPDLLARLRTSHDAAMRGNVAPTGRRSGR
jgi:hypothetical protein